MRSILDAVDRVAADFAEHSFLVSLDYAASLERLRRFVPGLTFWVLAYQDVLRLHEEMARDPLVRRVATTLRQNERGDDATFLSDMHLLGSELDLRSAFGREHVHVRDGAYALTSELFRAETEHARLAVLLVVAAESAVLRAKLGRFAERIAYREPLRWIPRPRPGASGQRLWDLELQADLASVILPTRTRAEALRVVERSDAALRKIMDHLARLARRPRVGAAVAAVAGGRRSGPNLP